MRLLPRRVAPDGLPAAVILAFMATAGFFYVNIMAAIVSGLIDSLHCTPQQAGRIGACNVYGAAAGAFLAVFIVRRVNWRRTAYFLLCSLILIDCISMGLRSVPALTALRLCHGLFGGLLVGVSFSVIARTRKPDRSFGMLLVVQSSLGGLGLMFLPRLVPSFGSPVLFAALAAFSAVALLLLPLLPDYPLPAARGDATPHAVSRAKSPHRFALVIALAAVFFFQAGNMAIAAYIIELGRAYGLSLELMTTTLGVAGWLAALGALLVVVLGDRYGRVRPIAIGMVLALVGNAAFFASALPIVYIVANIATSITWMFVIPYLLGLCASFDRSGRSAALAGLFSKLGLASGPFAASLFIDAHSYGTIIWLTLMALVLSALCGVVAANLVDRAGAAQPAAQ